ncbi:MAG TPA: hypothetical protein VFR94_05670 [Nitrososphaeraceae archaeon]|nr:hypothetical protein [Nitrososphaeraceae archaeon]
MIQGSDDLDKLYGDEGGNMLQGGMGKRPTVWRGGETTFLQEEWGMTF